MDGAFGSETSAGDPLQGGVIRIEMTDDAGTRFSTDVPTDAAVSGGDITDTWISFIMVGTDFTATVTATHRIFTCLFPCIFITVRCDCPYKQFDVIVRCCMQTIAPCSDSSWCRDGGIAIYIDGTQHKQFGWQTGTVGGVSSSWVKTTGLPPGLDACGCGIGLGWRTSPCTGSDRCEGNSNGQW